ncbi:hypothetical protein BT96DRAFT_1080589 [Gymnopus androsaceus JB14]|uniref:Tc1-like transposase DDE domain-containing protein n=1 Tax=Gymnopus androsaceus JB14 TaxID=1447944 RepID=A0A6A4I088_9AGAR|nr:hypothetical protein BT96DRAFT_1080589 [Gymnopus androsaceus JB14]
MVADFVSADYGWLHSKDGKESARVVFCPGKNCDGYFDNNDILTQSWKALDILTHDYPDEDHVLVFDNATTHLKRAEDALSARKMPKFTPKVGMNWGIEVTMKRDDGTIVYDDKGKPKKTKIHMRNGKFANATIQEFYYPEGHERAGVFKGMAQILVEQGYTNAPKLRAECAQFRCDPLLEGRCCCQRILFNEPDFAAGLSLLEVMCKEQGFQVIFLPKFHCELNFIEQCWGAAKRAYRLMPASSKEDDLEHNMIASLDAIELITMRRFMDAYHRGLTGKQAAWAGKKYHGHRVLPESLMKDMELDNMLTTKTIIHLHPA